MACSTALLLPPPSLELLVIEGVLQCDPDADEAAAALVLRAKFILIKAGGQLICGSEEAPFGRTGATLEIQLSGDSTAFEMPGSLRYLGWHPGVMTRLANRILVYGELKLFGRTRAYLVQEASREGSEYIFLNLLGKALTFTVDVSQVPCA